MTDTYTWNIVTMERHINDGVVYTVHWTVGAERTVNADIYTAGSYGSIGLGEPDPQAFIPYEDLTPEIVIDWVQQALGEEQVAQIESSLSKNLDTQEHPVDSFGVPW